MRGQMDFGIGQFAHFIVSDAAPIARYHRIHPFKTSGQIHGHHVELGARPPLHEQHLVIIRDVH